MNHQHHHHAQQYCCSSVPPPSCCSYRAQQCCHAPQPPVAHCCSTATASHHFNVPHSSFSPPQEVQQPQLLAIMPPPTPLMSLDVPAPRQQNPKPMEHMKLDVTIKKRKFKAIVDKKRHATSVNLTGARFVVRGNPPVNDTIIVPLEVRGRKIDVSCIVLDQQEKIVLGRQCLQAFGLEAGIVPRPSVHLRLGSRNNNGRSNNNSNRNHNVHRNRRNRGGRSGRAPINIGYGSRDLKAMFYPGAGGSNSSHHPHEEQDYKMTPQEEFLQIDVDEDLMQFD